MAKAAVLTEALPYIIDFRGSVVLVKVGGSVMEVERNLDSIMDDITFMRSVGMKVVIVHGGGKAISKALRDSGHEPKFVGGLRVTDEPTKPPAGESTQTPTQSPTEKPTPEPTEEPTAEPTEEPTEEVLDRDGTYTSKEDVALYLYLYGELPKNFITKGEAEKLGWEGGSVEKYAPGKSIGGDKFGNREGLLPKKNGRQYYECDIDTLGKNSRGAKRIVFSNDGLIYYTDDHYETFELLYTKDGPQ